MRTVGLKSTFKAHPIAKVVFGCVNAIYEVSKLKAGHKIMRLTVFRFFVVEIKESRGI